MNPRMVEAALRGEMVMVQIPREVVASCVTVPRLPETVTQDSVFSVFGIKPKSYLAFARAGEFPNQKRGRLRVALYSDVRAFLTRQVDRTRAAVGVRDGVRTDDVNGAMILRATKLLRRRAASSTTA